MERKKRKRKERNSKIRGKMRTGRKGMISTREKSQREKSKSFYVHVNTEL